MTLSPHNQKFIETQAHHKFKTFLAELAWVAFLGKMWLCVEKAREVLGWKPTAACLILPSGSVDKKISSGSVLPRKDKISYELALKQQLKDFPLFRCHCAWTPDGPVPRMGTMIHREHAHVVMIWVNKVHAKLKSGSSSSYRSLVRSQPLQTLFPLLGNLGVLVENDNHLEPGSHDSKQSQGPRPSILTGIYPYFPSRLWEGPGTSQKPNRILVSRWPLSSPLPMVFISFSVWNIPAHHVCKCQ